MAYLYTAASVVEHIKAFREQLREPSRERRNLPDYEVVIPAKNEELNIRDCLICVLSQTHKPKRVHVIEDGSSDRTLDVVLETIRSLPDDLYYENSNVVLGGLRFNLYKCVHGDIEVWVWSNNDNKSIGKGRAINALVLEGFIEAPYFVSVDGDTLIDVRFAEISLGKMVEEPNTAALYGYLVAIPEENTLIGKLYDWGYDISSRISHVVFRVGGNTLRFHYCLSGPRLVFSTSIYRKCPRPTDTKAGDTAHAWELQAEGYDIKCILDTYGVTRMPSRLKQIIRQRINWHSGPFQNLYIRGAKTIRRLRGKNKRKFLGGLFAIFYYALFSPVYHVKWGVVLPALTLLGYFPGDIALRYYLVDYTFSLVLALYSTMILRRYGYHRREKPWIFARNFNLFYFFFRPLVSWITLYSAFKTLFEVLYYKLIKKTRPVWTGYT